MKALTYTLKHIGILIVGVLLGVFFAWIVYDSRDLSASILSLGERQFIEESHRDAAYKKFDTEIEVFVSPQLQDYSQLFVSLLFSPSKLDIFSDQITSPYSFEILEEKSDALLLQIFWFGEWDVDEGVVIVPFSGEKKDITVEFVTNSLWEDGQSFAIGSLDVYVEHL